MAWRTVMIQNPARVKLHNRQLEISNEEGAATLPLEDIAALILESPQISLTSSLLSAAQELGVVIITCDDKHTPNGLLLPFHTHSRQSKIAHIQLSWSLPLKKRLWQRIIQAKIANQAEAVARCVCEEDAKHLRALVDRVNSGDPDNIEAQAARVYWSTFFQNFRRGDDDIVNAALNYGYAVVRAFVARSQVAYGLLPAFGIHHDNNLNAFNLTDDLMEVFRPFVDIAVFRMIEDGTLPEDQSRLPVAARQILANSGNIHCFINDRTQTLHTACEQMAMSFANAIEHKTPALLSLPIFPPDSEEK